MTVYLIRHGKTEANEKRLYCGSTDLPLSEEGKKELQNLRYEIEDVRFVTSGMKRTNETLKILFGDVTFEMEAGFREVDFGIFEMQSYEQLKARTDYQTWITGDNERNVPPQGESGVQMQQRVISAYNKIQSDTCIIAHGGVIASIMEYLFPNEGKNRYQWQPKNGCGYRIEGNSYKCVP